MNPQSKSGSWTWNLYRKWRPFLSIASIFRLRSLSLRDGENTLTREGRLKLRVKHPFDAQLEIREWSTDLNAIEEVLQDGNYASVVDLLSGCKTIVDLGANIGIATLYFAANFPESRIISVEAHPENFALLSRNVRHLVEQGRCLPLHAAVWSTSGRRLTFDAPNPLAFSGVSVVEGEPAEQGFSVLSITFREILERYQLTSVDLLKVDIEGAEVELLSGDISWMAGVRAIAIEFHGNSRERSNFDGMLEKYGFDVIATSPHTTLAKRRTG